MILLPFSKAVKVNRSGKGPRFVIIPEIIKWIEENEPGIRPEWFLGPDSEKSDKGKIGFSIPDPHKALIFKLTFG